MAFGFPPLPTPALNVDRRTLGDSWVRFLRELYKLRIGQGAFLDGGELIEDQDLSPFADNSISHTLKRVPTSCLIVEDQGVECFFQASLVGAQSIVDTDGWTRVALDTETFDHGSVFASQVFTAPVTGLYAFCGTAELASVADGFDFECRLNVGSATAIHRGTKYTSGGAGSLLSVVSPPAVKVTSSQTVALEAQTSDTTSRTLSTGAAQTQLSGRLIRETWEDASQRSASALVLRTTYEHTVSLWVM